MSRGRIAFWIAWSMIAVVVAMRGASSVPTHTTRQDTPDGSYFVGYLAWNEGKGRILWSPGDSEDPGGALPSEFVSEPLPRTVFVNGSRLIELELYTPGRPTPRQSYGPASSCGSGQAQLSAELYAGTEILGYADPGQSFKLRGSAYPYPPDPEGHGVCHLRMQSELSQLVEGSVLRLQLDPVHQQGGFGMAGDHASVLRIPFFSEEELAFRYPMGVHGSPETATGKNMVTGLLSGAGIAGIVAGASVFRHRRAVLLAGLLMVASMAGCMSANSNVSLREPGFTSGSLAPSYQPGNLSHAGHGALAGDVRSADVGQAIGGAHVIVLGSPASAQTDRYGRFAFRDLVSGHYTLRVDHADYHPFEAPVEIKADLVARVHIVLEPTVKDPNVRPHLHDYWSGKEEMVLMDRVDLGYGCPDPTYPCQSNLVFTPPRSADRYTSILPGTYEVNVTLEWDPDRLPHRTVGLMVQANNDPSFDNWTVLMPREAGVPFHIATTWEMQDPGHQRFSTWLFQIYVAEGITKDTVSGIQDFARRYVEGAGFLATVTIRKGVVPLEPSHPDLWAGQRTVRVISDSVQAPSRASSGDADLIKPWTNIWFPSYLIPPDATALEIWANASRALVPEHEVELRYKSAEHGPPTTKCWTTAPNGYGGLYCDGPEYVRPGGAERIGNSLRWVVPLGPRDPDPFYSVRSFWAIGLGSKPDDANNALSMTDAMAGNYVGGMLTYALTVVAMR